MYAPVPARIGVSLVKPGHSNPLGVADNPGDVFTFMGLDSVCILLVTSLPPLSLQVPAL